MKCKLLNFCCFLTVNFSFVGGICFNELSCCRSQASLVGETGVDDVVKESVVSEY